MDSYLILLVLTLEGVSLPLCSCSCISQSICIASGSCDSGTSLGDDILVAGVDVSCGCVGLSKDPCSLRCGLLSQEPSGCHLALCNIGDC